ncbi:MAG TPA: hypothetical protein VG733_06280 [Chthoniobacteraceae bacterium]|nr:hypothetical protein [Chthoniobacteraceae bacterium]
MKIPFPRFAAASLALFLTAAAAHAADQDRDALEIGRAIITVDKAFKYELPDNPTPADTAKSETLTKAAVEAGQITRLYPWVSARITQEIALAQSQLRDTHPDESQTRKLNKRIAYLQHLKLLIDAPL